MIHFFFLLDASGSMYGSAIQLLNEAMTRVLSDIQKVCNDNGVTPLVHALAFNSSTQWLCNTSATIGLDPRDIVWNNLSASGGTDTASAINELIAGLSPRHLGAPFYRPVIILLTDGYSNDIAATAAAIDRLITRCPKSLRIAVGVNDYDCRELEAFASPAIVILTNEMGDEVASREQKLIFPLNHVDQLVDALRTIATSASGTSIRMGKGDDNDPGPMEFILPDCDNGPWL